MVALGATALFAEDLLESLDPAARATLARDKILIGNTEFKQCFQPYLDGGGGSDADGPSVFITSDALLSAFHVVFEESLTRMEIANVPKLENLLAAIVAGLPQATAEMKGVDPFKPEASRRAEIMLKTALRLLEKPAAGSSPEIERIIADQAAEIRRATGIRKPEWLGPPDREFLTLDFSRYTPRGFYDRSPGLRRYFRALSWLQSVPFRMDHAEEYLAVRLIGRAAVIGTGNTANDHRPNEPLLRAWHAFIGIPDDPDLHVLMSYGGNDYALRFPELKTRDDFANWVADHLRPDDSNILPPVDGLNDTLRDPPAAKAAYPPPTYRILSAHALPDSILFQSTSTAGGPGTARFPNPLEIAAGLGSPFAAKAVAADVPPDCWKAMQPALKTFSDASADRDDLYHQYLAVLRELANPPDPAAPDFMRGEPWQRKSCQTLLASWTQMRHSLVLQAKTNECALCISNPPPGFVEPDPEFFRRLGDLILACVTTFSEAAAFDENSEAIILDCLKRGRDAAASLHKSGFSSAGREFTELNQALNRVRSGFPLPAPPRHALPDSSASETEGAKFQAEAERLDAIYHGELAQALASLIEKIEAALPTERTALLAKLRCPPETTMERRWQGLGNLCSQAQSIAHRQLRQQPLTTEQNAWIRQFGVLLGKAMFYDGNSYVFPNDDAPRVVDVFSSQGTHLHAAVGRPRLLYVLYPWQGREVLCLGAVLPYHEFLHGPDRLTDSAWLEKLKSSPPPPPSWMNPILQTPASPTDPAAP